MENKTLGEVLRAMVDEALKSDDLSFSLPVSKIAYLVNGNPLLGKTTDEIRELKKVPQLRSSYIYNTTSRMGVLQEKGLKVKHSIEENEDGNDELYIKLTPGNPKVGGRKVKSDESYQRALNDIKARILKLNPNIVEFDGDELSGAIKAIRMYHDMIKEMK